jgi:hypothetical protein
VDETGWLIERNTNGRAEWLCYDECDLSSFWSHDSSQAVRFARQIDGIKIRAYMQLPIDQISVTEHIWSA